MKKNKLKREAYSNFVLISQIGFHMLVPIFACVAVGVFIDGKYHTYLTLPLLILGILAGGRNAYALAKSANRKSEDQMELELERKMVEEAVKQWNEGRQFAGNDNAGGESVGNENREEQPESSDRDGD